MSVSDMFSCEGKIALVTGAACGLGFTFAETMAEVGADVACADVNGNGLPDIVRAVERHGRKAIAIQCDVADEAAVIDMVGKTVREFGRLDILFNNAGIGANPKPLHELSTEEWNHVVGIDLQGAFYCAREALKVMVPQRSGKIINTLSVWGRVGSSSLMTVPAYTAAKGGLANLTRELGLFYGPLGINVNGICPGFIRTRIGNDSFDDPEFVRAMVAFAPIGRVGMPSELKGVAVLLASDASSYMCGELIAVDGGILAK